jgi:IS4 transposase
VHGVFDLGRGRFSHLALTDVQGAESMARGAALEGEIRIGDRNYARAGVLRELREQSNNKTDFIVRMSWRTFTLTTQDGRRFNLADHLARLPDSAGPHEICVFAKTGRQTPPLPLRVIIMRKSPEAAETARRKLPRNAQRKQKKLDPRTVVAAGFVILATSLPTEGYKADAIFAAYRLRWQIELAFKRLKSLLHIDQIPTRTALASRSWLLAHLVLALLCDDMTQDFLESSP